MTSEEIRKKFLEFFEKRGHTILPSASLVPENDPTTLFNTAGMQPLVPYLLGKPHPAGNRLANIQKCVRTGDIDEVGDNTHLTFFEMMGNWSLGDYFKEDAINWRYQLLTDKKEGFGLDPQRLYVTCFEGNDDAPRDEESAKIWKEIFEKNNVKGERIYFRPAEKNWWSPGPNGPCGPDTEMFYDLTGTLTKGLTLAEYLKADDEQRLVEIWNDVFMEYLQKDGKVVEKLQSKNVDTGSGFERVCTVLQGKTNVFDTDLFEPIMKEINQFSGSEDLKVKRIVADHMRTAIFMIADGVTPSHEERGSILRRLITKVVKESIEEINLEKISNLFDVISRIYSSSYPILISRREEIVNILNTEIARISKRGDKIPRLLSWLQKRHDFRKGKVSAKPLNTGQAYQHISIDDLKNFGKITAKDAFDLKTQEGIDLDLLINYVRKYYNFSLPIEEDIESKFNVLMSEFQNTSRAGMEKKFKGGLGGHSEMEVKYHTATHLLHKALREVLGEHVEQKGSNITPERLRFDFSHPSKMTDEEKKKVEERVNQKIKEDLPVKNVVLPKEEAEKSGALHFFGDKYGDQVSVYYIGDSLDTAYSKEFCGGPHVERTSDLASSRDPEQATGESKGENKKVFKILKEEAISQGIRRIKAVLV